MISFLIGLYLGGGLLYGCLTFQTFGFTIDLKDYLYDVFLWPKAIFD